MELTCSCLWMIPMQLIGTRALEMSKLCVKKNVGLCLSCFRFNLHGQPGARHTLILQAMAQTVHVCFLTKEHGVSSMAWQIKVNNVNYLRQQRRRTSTELSLVRFLCLYFIWFFTFYKLSLCLGGRSRVFWLNQAVA